MRCLALVLTLLATPALGDACEDQFRAGMVAGASVEARLGAVEERLYGGPGWVNRSAVLRRLEARSAVTDTCQEIAALRGELTAGRARLDESERAFRLAAALCWDANRARAGRNLAILDDSARAIDDLMDYLASLTRRC